MAASGQLLIQHVEHQVGQQGREWATLWHAFVRRPDQPVRQHARAQNAADEPEKAPVADPLRHQPHQEVLVDPVEEFLQVEIDHAGVPFGDIGLGSGDRLMGGSTGPKAVARVRERRVPAWLQHLQHRLLDEAVEHRRDAEGAHAVAPASLGDLDPQHRLRSVDATEQLGPDRGPVVPQVGREFVDGHPVDAGRASVAPDLRQGLAQVVALDNRLHERPRGRRGFGPGGRRADFGPFLSEALGFTRRPRPKGQLQLDLLPLGRHESSRPTSPSHVRAFGLPEPAYYALC
jgi:hypothetical protein